MEAAMPQTVGKNPYGRPVRKGNADDLWRRALATPCPSCGATKKRVVIVKDRATIFCGSANDVQDVPLTT